MPTTAGRYSVMDLPPWRLNGNMEALRSDLALYVDRHSQDHLHPC